jgi:pimeloyl-ACP methyl ester carboxylesterase
VIIAPGTYWITPNAAALGAIVDAMSYIYPIDASRVYLMGHSIGATAAMTAAARQPERVAAVVAFSGGGDFGQATRLPPTLVYCGELDPIVPASRLTAETERAKRSRLPVELRVLKDRGHTLVINDAMPKAVEWVLKHSSRPGK